ncbi:MAG: tetratricopeptide repeat protein, partial [Treponema sp.]|nr:tetratricopeptide repeat protein [Treponema sp.]
MPSLDDLDKFRDLFRKIGKEAEDLAAKGVPFDDLDLPDNGKSSSPAGNIAIQRENTADDASVAERLDAAPDFDLDDLFENAPPLEKPVKTAEHSEAAAGGDLNLDDLFDAGEFNSSVSANDLSFDDLFDADASDAPSDLPDFNEDATPLPPLDGDSLASQEDAPPDGLNIDDLPDFNEDAPPLPPPDGDSLASPDAPPDGLNIDEFPDFNKDATPLPPVDGDAGGTTSEADATNFEQPDIAMPEALITGEEIEDFVVPGLDDILNKSAEPLPGLSKSSENIEEIILSEEDYEHVKNALASYPLNLRIACEELIAEEAVAPDMMSKLITLLIEEAHAQEVADLAGKIQGRIINIPKGFEKKTGADLEAEKNSFKYIFIHKVLPIAGFALFGILVALSIAYLVYKFIYIPLYAESIYKQGHVLIDEGKYPEANKKFTEALKLRRVKKWFYRYAEAFAGKRQYLFAEEKYEALLKHYPKEKRAVLDYAALETNQLQNYEKADGILRKYILNYTVDDKDALLAVGDNALAWGEIDPSKYDLAREAYARYIEAHGQNNSVLERMLKYFIRTDNLKEALPLQRYFSDPEMEKKRHISAETFTEMSGYLLDKQFEETDGVPDEYVSQITDVRNLLLKAVEKGPAIPEAHYNLSRYYHYFDNTREERSALEHALPLFDADSGSSAKRTKIWLDAERRYAEALIANKEFFAAEEHLQKGIELYEDALSHNFIQPDPQSARLYADMGDLEYFTKDGDMDMALRYYARAEQNGWSPPEMQYRMGSAHYHLRQWAQAQERFTAATDMAAPPNRRILNALGNVAYIRGDFFMAQAHYSRLIDMLNADKNRFSDLSPQTRPDHFTLVQRLMMAENNMGVTLETLTA